MDVLLFSPKEAQRREALREEAEAAAEAAEREKQKQAEAKAAAAAAQPRSTWTPGSHSAAAPPRHNQVRFDQDDQDDPCPWAADKPGRKRKAHRSKHKHESHVKRTRREKGDVDEEPPPVPKPLPHITTFEQYYQMQGFLSDEWGPFIAALRRPLPVTFRVSCMTSKAVTTRECLSFGEPFLNPKAESWDHRGRVIPPPRKLEWVEGWQLGCDKFTLKVSSDPSVRELRSWLAKYGQVGVLTRQEVVSMIPAALLDPQPHHAMLDMCASPGSKTTQLLEALWSKEGVEATGRVVANDVDPHRSYMLVRRCANLGAACANLVITCHAGQRVPNVECPGRPKGLPRPAPAEGQSSGRYPEGVYDRIICDVPCSGDGTLRKLPEVWKQWHPDYGVKLHGIQLQIALRGLALLKVGGIMCYSTCTFNPIEDEAVVGELLSRARGAVELVDASGLIPKLLRRPGITKWKVINDALQVYPTFESSQAKHIPRAERRRYRRSMWPHEPSPHPLHRCMRMFPHLQDTGGFFVAMLRKVAPFPGPPPKPGAQTSPSQTAARSASNGAASTAAAPEAAEKAPRGGHKYRKINPDSMKSVVELLGMDRKKFKKELGTQLYSRSRADRNVTFVPACVSQAVFDPPGHHRLKHVWCGLRLFETDRKTKDYRITQEGLPLVGPLVLRQRVRFGLGDLEELLKRPGWAVPLSAFSRAAAAQLEALLPGACVIVPTWQVDPDNPEAPVVAAHRLDEPPALVVHFTRTKGREHAPKAAAQALLGTLRRTHGTPDW